MSDKLKRALEESLLSKYHAQMPIAPNKPFIQQESTNNKLRPVKLKCGASSIFVLVLALLWMNAGNAYTNKYEFIAVDYDICTDIRLPTTGDYELSDDMSVHYYIDEYLGDFTLTEIYSMPDFLNECWYESDEYTLFFQQFSGIDFSTGVNTEGYELEKYQVNHESEAYYVNMTKQHSQFFLWAYDGYVFTLNFWAKEGAEAMPLSKIIELAESVKKIS